MQIDEELDYGDEVDDSDDILDLDDDLLELGAGEETDEEREDREAEEAKAAREANIRIPKARFDEAVGAERARADQLAAQLEQERAARQQPQGPNAFQKLAADIETLQDEYEELLIDGLKDEAKAVRTQLNRMRDKYTDARTHSITEQAKVETQQAAHYHNTLAGIEAAYPTLNPDHAQFNDAAAAEVADLMRAFVANGEASATALQRAAKYVMGTAAPAAPTRATASRQRAAEAQLRQPYDTAITGRTSAGDAQGLHKVSFEEFKKLDDKTLARARGDLL